MKRTTFLLIILLVLSSISSAQMNRKHKQKWSFALAVNNIYYPMGVFGYPGSVSLDGIWTNGNEKEDNSYSLSIIPKYLINNDLSLRFEFGITNVNQNVFINSGITKGTPPPVSYSYGWDTISERTYKYIPGIEWSCLRTDRIELHIGILIPYFHCSEFKENLYSETRDKVTDTLIFTGKVNRTIQGGFAVGFGSLIGSDFYLSKNISLGLEFSTAYLFYRIGGDGTEVDVNQFSQQAPTSKTTISPISYKGSRLEKVFASFNILIHM